MNEYRKLPDEGDPPPAEFRVRYLEMPTKIVGNGEDLEDIDLNGGWAIGLAFNFYFWAIRPPPLRNSARSSCGRRGSKCRAGLAGGRR